MIKTIETRIPYLSLIGANISDVYGLEYRFMYLINNRVVLHNDQLDIDYIVLKVEVSEEVFSHDYKVRITIDTLNDIDKDIQHQLNTFKHSLTKLLPTKRGENRGAKE